MKDIPKHIAIIMDGNGRWAKKRNQPRFQGHLEGIKSIERIAKISGEYGVQVLTLFAFSTENWGRPKQEVSMLMNAFCQALDKKIAKLIKADIRLSFIGRREGVPEQVLKSIDNGIKQTQSNKGLILNIAFNYGARQEIVDAVKQIAAKVEEKQLRSQDINEKMIDELLYTKGLPEPDLLIRTSGEQRISNFLLWQLSYAELYFTDVLWPDFNDEEFKKAIRDFQKRERRYGKVSLGTK